MLDLLVDHLLSCHLAVCTADCRLGGRFQQHRRKEERCIIDPENLSHKICHLREVQFVLIQARL
jgi:hypothetical protein